MTEMRELVERGNIDLRAPEGQQRLMAGAGVRNQMYAQQIMALLTPAQRERVQDLNNGIPALRERLGIPEPGQQRGQQQAPRRPEFVPGEGSWRPGMPLGDSVPAAPPRGTFPRTTPPANPAN